MKISGWGRYPIVDATVEHPPFLSAVSVGDRPVIPRGLGRSYGDSAIGADVIDITALDRLQSFDDETGTLVAESGFTIDEMLRVFVPRGWFPPVTPGTRFVTLGGAIGADVHGKNHHVAGSIGDHVLWMEILLGDGRIVTASREENADLFIATIGGMGLTGIILTVALRLQRVTSSRIEQVTVKAPNLDAALEAFEEHKSATYSVAWIDCIAAGRQLGRSILTVGEHADDGVLATRGPGPLVVPFDAPNWALNPVTMRAFNSVYYAKELKPLAHATVPFESFFYPLDGIREWNRAYGRRGFVQYQFVIPLTAGRTALTHILKRIAESRMGSTLAVLKVFGAGNDSPLSFPEPGYTLALDFAVSPAAFALMDELDRLVLDYGGRHYLAKDSRMSADTFRAGYPQWEEFEQVRNRYRAIGAFASTQSRRLELA